MDRNLTIDQNPIGMSINGLCIRDQLFLSGEIDQKK